MDRSTTIVEYVFEWHADNYPINRRYYAITILRTN